MPNIRSTTWPSRARTDERLGADPARTDRQGCRRLLIDAIKESAVLRVRPKAMTVAVILAGLVPIFVGSGTGSEVMQRPRRR